MKHEQREVVIMYDNDTRRIRAIGVGGRVNSGQYGSQYVTHF